MAVSVYDYVLAEASSSTTGGWNTAEGQDPATVNDGMRAHKQNVAGYLDDEGAVNTVAGTGDVITITTGQPFTAYGTGAGQIGTGVQLRFIASAANTTNVTLNVNSIGAKAVRKISGGTDVALASGDIVAGETYTLIYRATANAAAGGWVMIGAAAVAAATLTSSGIVELATVAEAATGTDAVRAVTPAGLYYPSGHLFGATMTNGTDATNDINIAAGTCRDSTDTANMVIPAIVKQLDAAWAVGTNAGGLDTGAIANTTYHLYAIKRVDTNVVDVIFSASASAPTLPTNYTLYRRIGSIIRASAAIKGFIQIGDDFWFSDGVGVLDVNVTNPGTSAVTRTLTVPTGINVNALMNVGSSGQGTGVQYILLSDLAVTDAAPSQTAAPLGSTGHNVNASIAAQVVVRTNTSAQIRSRAAFSDANTIIRIATMGWQDRRGRLA